jgi:hypothetical protein
MRSLKFTPTFRGIFLQKDHMPYKSEKIAIKNPTLDRRVKLLPSDKEKIKKLHQEGIPIREITRRYKVSRRLIQFILFPERLAKINYPGHWKKYYKKEKQTIAIRKHRRYKQELFKKGQLKQEE